MSSIFDNTQVAAWLTDITVPKRQGELGHTLGMALGAGLLAMQQDPNTIDPATGQTQIDPGTGEQKGWMETRKGWTQGMHEARLNEQDPNWQVKTKALEAGVVNNWARAATEWQQFDTANRDMSDWMLHDLPEISKYQQDLKTNPDATPPIALSPKGQQALQQFQTNRLRKATLDFKQEQAENMLDIAQQKVDAASVESKQTLELSKQQSKFFFDNINTVANTTDKQKAIDLWGQGKKSDALAIVEGSEGYKSALIEKRGDEQRKTDAARAKTPRETAAIQNIKQIETWEQQAKDAEAAGDSKTAQDLKKMSTQLQEQMKGWGMTMGYDDQGRQIFSMGKGSQATVGTQTMAQGKMLQYENAAQQIDYLMKNLTAAHVGMAGAAGELFVDKSMEQLFPGSENKGRVQVRSTMTYLRDGLMREMADDRSGRFSAADREEVGKALPSNGVFESEADAKDRLERVRQILASRTKVYARKMGIPTPTWSLNEKDQKEIIQRVKDGVASKLDPDSDEFKNKGFLTKDQGIEALQRSE